MFAMLLSSGVLYQFLVGVLLAGSASPADPPSSVQVSTAHSKSMNSAESPSPAKSMKTAALTPPAKSMTSPESSLPATLTTSSGLTPPARSMKSTGLGSSGTNLTQRAEDFDARLRKTEAASEQSGRNSGTVPEDRTSTRQQVDESSLFGAIEVTFLKTRISGIQPAYEFGTGRMLDTDHETALRYVLGYNGKSGLGLRARYWSFDDSADFVEPFKPEHLYIKVQSADTEIFTAHNTNDIRFEFAAGLRYGKLEYFSKGVTLFGVGECTFEGVGPTIAIDIRRDVPDTGLTLFGNLRGAAILGDISNKSLLVDIQGSKINDEFMTVLENQLGVAWRADLFRESTLVLQAAWETQLWQSNTLSDDVYGIGSNLLLTGPAISATLEY